MKSLAKCLLFLRRLLAAISLLAMTAVFFAPSAARWLGWLPRLQLVPAILAGAVLQIVVLVVLVALFGRLYCSIICPLGVLQDLIPFALGRFCRHPAAVPADAVSRMRPSRLIRHAVLALFILAIPFGLTGLVEPYGIFGRFLAVGVRRAGEPAVVTLVWVIGLVAFILAMTLVRARWWCNRVCPVGTFLGLFSRFALVRVRIDADACVKCGACARYCDAGALSVRADRTIAIDHASCVVCGKCLGVCLKDAISLLKK